MEKAPNQLYYIKPPNGLTVTDYEASISFIFENGKLRERRGRIPLTWYIEGTEEDWLKRAVRL